MLKKTLYKLLPLFLILLVLSFLLPGCTGTTEMPSTTTTGNAPDSAAILDLYGIDPHTLDPAISGDSTSHQYVMQIFSGLVQLDDSMEPEPDIALNWDISEDGTEYTFYLRDDVTFQDGTPVTAADFKYSWERTCNPETGSSTAETYLGDIVGVSDVLSGKATEISGVTVINDYTLKVTFDARRSYILYKLAYPTTFVVDKKNVESGENWWYDPNGTGPFKLKEWIEGEILTLEWNDRFYGALPKLSTVNFLLWSGVPINMYETGEIDATYVPVSYIDKVTDPTSTLYDQLTVSPEFSFYYLGFNHEEEPFDDVNVRKAFSMAIDREKIVSLIYRDMMQEARGIIPAGMPGYNEDLTGYEYNPELALKLIAESRYGSVAKLPEITLTVSGLGGVISSDLEAIIDQWRNNLGVEVKVRQLEPNRYVYHLNEEKDQLFDMGWIADYPHPEGFLAVLFKAGVDNNYGGYSNKEYDSLLDTAGRELDMEKSFGLYRQAEEILVEDAACIPLWFGKNYTLVKPYVHNYVVNPLGIVMLDKVSIDIE